MTFPIMSLTLFLLVNAAALCASKRTCNASWLPVALVVSATTLPVIARKMAWISSTQGERIAALVSVAALLVACARVRWRSLNLDVADFAVLLLYLTSFIAWTLSGGHFGATSAGEWAIELAPPIVALCVRRLASVRAQIRAVAWSSAAVTLPSAVLSLSGTPLAHMGFGEDDASSRLSGITSHPNNLGTTALLFAATSVGLSHGARAGVGLLIGGYVIVETDQRSAIIPYAGLVVFYLVRTLVHRVGSTFRPVVAMGTLAALVALVPYGASLLTKLISAREASVVGREDIWRFVLGNRDAFLPIGRGPRGLYDMTSQISLGEPFFHAHDQVITWYTIAGVPALFVVLLLAIAAGSSVKRSSVSSRLLLLALVVPLLFESPLHTGFSSLPEATAMLCWVSLLTVIPSLASSGRAQVRERRGLNSGGQLSRSGVTP